ncbi:alkene reductase [Oricola cellulosilytica]|uniref:Alkene reductase n=1 Tax=Oricola cellulosilytica TaxID=1429082 RepID=A0A4R0PKA3_9HYPH|nr:alkene reductase [Oricola cellulosilytica]TCD16039.1 alkene reductase [Oricola cellulosilytica]
MAKTDILLKPSKLGDISVPNRVFMAPLTRNRAHDDGTPWEEAATYYAQRANAGLIITEATQMHPLGKGYIQTPGIHEPKHVEAWKEITRAVHAAGGRIFVQLWHVGRIRHSSIEPEGEAPVAPTAEAAEAQTFTKKGFEPTSKPRELTVGEIEALVADYAKAARNAMEAGFDGVEVHCANGYLLNQFLHSGSNKRDDEYGGSIENRCRFPLEAVDAVIAEIGAGRVGVRTSPLGEANDVPEDDPRALYTYFHGELAKRGLAYLHVMESFPGSDRSEEKRAVIEDVRKAWNGFYITNGGYDAERAAEALETGHADAVAFGRPYISNPDLAVRIAMNVEWAEPNQETFYGGGEKGYTDYSDATLKAA